MTFTAQSQKFRLPDDLAAGLKGKRVLITGAGKDGGIGQGFALAAGLNGAESVGVHFHSSYDDGLDLVNHLKDEGVNAFPLQADVTNTSELWSTRSYVVRRMGDKLPNLIICNSGLTEDGYSFGRALRREEGEARARRRARVRKNFINDIRQSCLVLQTKVDGFMAMTHLWSGEAVHHERPLQIVYVSSMQAIEPGKAVPAYVISNWAVLQLPRVLNVNLGRSADLVSSCCVLLPFVHTGMTEDYADNEKVFGRWQPRMLKTHECAEAVAGLLTRDAKSLDQGLFQLTVTGDDPESLDTRWEQVHLDVRREPLAG